MPDHPRPRVTNRYGSQRSIQPRAPVPIEVKGQRFIQDPTQVSSGSSTQGSVLDQASAVIKSRRGAEDVDELGEGL